MSNSGRMQPAMAAVAALALALGLGACESRGGTALLGGAAGAAAGAGGYEYHLNRQKERVESDLAAGRITQSEYDIRMDQIRRDSFIQ